MRSHSLLLTVLFSLAPLMVQAQEPAQSTGAQPAPQSGHADHSQMDHGASSPPPATPAAGQVDHSQHGAAPARSAPAGGEVDRGQINHGPTTSPPRAAPASAGHDSSGAMDHGAMQGGKAPPDARDPHAYADGYGFGRMQSHMGDQHRLGQFIADRFERAETDDGAAVAYDALAWYGNIYDRAWLKAEGEHEDGETAARTELLWGHAVAPFWDAQLGVRYDSGPGEDRPWLAFGVQGTAPYRFNVEATGYLGEEGRSAVRLETEYEWLFTQRLVLQPRFETNLYGKRDPERGLGSGLANMALGLRLRYEIRREFAPYIGIEYARKFGGTADLARAAGDDADETLYVVGLRFWF